MSTTQKVLTPTSVGRFVSSIRSVANSSDGLVVCSDCRRHMSDLATSCPHCDAEAVATGEFTAVELTSAPAHVTAGDVGTMSLLVLGLGLAAYAVALIAGV
jgi:hypothetical protein